MVIVLRLREARLRTRPRLRKERARLLRLRTPPMMSNDTDYTIREFSHSVALYHTEQAGG